MPARGPRYDIRVGNKSLDDLDIRHLVSNVVCDREIGKFDSLQVEFIYGPELVKAHQLMQHGRVVELYLGYADTKLKKVMFGFISGVKIKGSTREVKINVAGYLASLNEGKKERVLSGKTLQQIVETILSEYESLCVGTIQNGDLVLASDETQTSMTDLEFLEKVAAHFGMFIRLEEAKTAGAWCISMYELGKDVEKHAKPLVMKPNTSQQDYRDYAHLREFDPESNILGLPVDVSIVSVNPEYRYETQTVLESPETTTEVLFGNINNESSLFGQLATDDTPDVPPMPYQTQGVDPNLYAGGVVAGAHMTPMGLPSVMQGESQPGAFGSFLGTLQAGSDGIGQYVAPPSEPVATYEAPAGYNGTPMLITVTTPAVYSTQENRIFEATTVVFSCFGEISTIQFAEDVSSEEALSRIADAIRNGEGFDFVVVKNAELAQGDPDLDLGQKRQVFLNDYPLYGEAFSGEYSITKVRHEINRGSSFTTKFSGSMNSLTIPVTPVPLAVSIDSPPVTEADEEFDGLFRPNLSNIVGAPGVLDPNSIVMTGGQYGPGGFSLVGILGVTTRQPGAGLNVDLYNSTLFMGTAGLPEPTPAYEFPFPLPFSN